MGNLILNLLYFIEHVISSIDYHYKTYLWYKIEQKYK